MLQANENVKMNKEYTMKVGGIYEVTLLGYQAFSTKTGKDLFRFTVKCPGFEAQNIICSTQEAVDNWKQYMVNHQETEEGITLLDIKNNKLKFPVTIKEVVAEDGTVYINPVKILNYSTTEEIEIKDLEASNVPF